MAAAENWTRGQREEVSPFRIHLCACSQECYHQAALEASSFLFLLLLHSSLEEPTPAV